MSSSSAGDGRRGTTFHVKHAGSGGALEAAYVELLRDAPLNLVSARDRSLLSTRHLPEARAFADGLPADAGVVIDVGSGGGLPGLVIAMRRPSTPVVLVESRERKASWLQATVSELGLDNVEVRNERVERLQGLAGEGDVITARAVAPLPRLLGFCAPVARRGATLHAIKGERWPDELAASAPTSELGWDVVATPATDVDGHRTRPQDLRDPHPLVVILRSRG